MQAHKRPKFRNGGERAVKKVRRILQTGSIREVREMYVPESFRPRGRRKGPSRRSQEKNNLDAAIREAATILDANFFYARGDRLVTLRYDDAHLPETEEQARENETRIIAVCRRWAKKNGKSFRFFVVTSDKKRNGDPARLHHHLVISAVPAEALRAAWPYGTVDDRSIWDEESHGALAAYLVKQAIRGRNVKKWRSSRNLARTVMLSEQEVLPESKYRIPKGAKVIWQGEYDPAMGKLLHLKLRMPEKEEAADAGARPGRRRAEGRTRGGGGHEV